jgi:phage-related protein
VKNLIRESLYFSFANRKSTDFNIMNISVSDSASLYEESVIANKTINEIYVRGNPKPYFIDTKKDPYSFQLRFAFDDTADDELIDEVIRWLNVDFYQPLFFSEDINKVFYAMPVNDVSFIHNGLKQGYLNLTMRCDSPFSYGNDILTNWYDYSSDNTDLIEITNLGHFSIYPEIWIQKVGNGNLSINNLTNSNQEFKFSNLQDGEQLYIDCENEYIETSLTNTFRYDDFNDGYLEIVYGKNRLIVTGNAKLRFRYRYTYS